MAIPGTRGDKRLEARQPVLKAAKARFGNSVVDCLVLDVSETGVRVSTDAFIAFPDEVTLELRSGGTWQAIRRWQHGLETGFEFVRFTGLHAQAMIEASALYEQLRNAGLIDVITRLSVARYWDHPDLKAASEAAEAAVHELERVLRQATGHT